MEWPERTKQKKAESESYAILLYKLRKIGIFRNLTENDYGIDFEIELVRGDSVTGQYFKAQVKSAEEINIRSSDNVPTVSGIKQSTLNYWCELSYKTHVIAYAVDLKSEQIFVSRPLFWQATRLLDATKKTKTIEFVPMEKELVEAPLALTLYGALSPSVGDIIYAHTTALRYLRDFFELYGDVFHYDKGMEIHRPEIFQTFLETCRLLLSTHTDRLDLAVEDKEHAFSFRHWAAKSGESTQVTNYAAQAPMRALLPLLIESLNAYKKRVLGAVYYWGYRNQSYLALVHKSVLPDKTDDATLQEWSYKFDELAWPPVEDVQALIAKHRKTE